MAKNQMIEGERMAVDAPFFPVFRRGEKPRFRRADTVIDGTMYLIREISAAHRSEWNDLSAELSDKLKAGQVMKESGNEDGTFPAGLIYALFATYHLVGEDGELMYDMHDQSDAQEVADCLPGHVIDKLWDISHMLDDPNLKPKNAESPSGEESSGK